MRKLSLYSGMAAFAAALMISAAVNAADSQGDRHGWRQHDRPQSGPGNSQSISGSQGRVWQHQPGSNGPGNSNAPGTSWRGNAQRIHQFHGGDVNHFDSGDRSMWTSGNWQRGHHHDHDGWWWFTGGGWYFYPEPIYPYPAYVSSDVIYDYQDDGYQDSGYNDQGATWYYCNDPRGYYPYVRSCHGHWEAVPATPPDLQQDQSGPGDEGPPPDDRDGPGMQQRDNGDQNGPPDNGPPPDDAPPPGH